MKAVALLAPLTLLPLPAGGSSCDLNDPDPRCYFAARWNWQSQWQLDASVDTVGRRLRQQGDPRDALGGYASTNLSLRRLQLPGGSAVSLSVRNLFDVDTREPSAGPTPGQSSPAIPDDIPEAGRSLVLAGEMSW